MWNDNPNIATIISLSFPIEILGHLNLLGFTFHCESKIAVLQVSWLDDNKIKYVYLSLKFRLYLFYGVNFIFQNNHMIVVIEVTLYINVPPVHCYWMISLKKYIWKINQSDNRYLIYLAIVSLVTEAPDCNCSFAYEL